MTFEEIFKSWTLSQRVEWALGPNIFNLSENMRSIIVDLKTENERLLKIVRHQKYKRCLTMAEWCDAEADVADADGDYDDMQWYQKWHTRYLEYAEIFKPNKTTAQ